MKITVFTPIYNRAYNLKNLYNSLLSQTYKDFEWIIVDDGSVDNAKEQVKEFQNENKISIIYTWQINKGKHFAINKGVSLAKGELFFILDSDDELPVFSLETVVKKYAEVDKDLTIGGVAGRGMYKSGEIVGNNNFSELTTDSLQVRFNYKVTGDLSEVFKTEVLREFPFPEIENEKFCPEALVWNRIAQKYKLRFFNIPIYTIEYMPDGLTAKIVKIRMTSPIASMLTYSELESYSIPIVQKIKANINFWRFSFNSNYGFSKRLNMVSKFRSILGFPLGFALYLKDKKDNK